VVFQSRALDADISVRQNLLYHAALHGIGRGEALARAEEVLRQAGLADRARERTGNLSGGQMRRVEIARALLHRPRLLLLDEPTVGLDVRARATILAHVRQLLGGQGVGVLWATHLIDEVAPGDDVVVLHKGRVLARGPLASVLKATGESELRAAFASLAQFDAEEEAGAA
jgi:ABC-2 type transport system ATP-binding protein